MDPEKRCGRRRTERRCRLLIAAAVPLAAVWLPAEVLADPVRVELFTKVAQGEKPRVKVIADEAVSSVSVELTRSDGKRFGAKLGSLAAGASREVQLGGEPGKAGYRGKVVVMQKGDRSENELDFEAVVAPPLKLQVDKSKVDLKNRKLELKMSREAGKVEVKVYGDTGLALTEASHDFTNRPAGDPLEVTWEPIKGEVAKIELRAYDADGFFSGMALLPWSVHIPHEEVNFRTDSAEIDASERPKVDASYTKITDAINRHKDLGPIKLFIAGHTDTVGGDSYNLQLSQQRARSIGGWFRKRGLRIPIAYEGFGEHAPLVKTADNIDEPRNRRVDYILAIEEPQLKATGYRAGWKRIP